MTVAYSDDATTLRAVEAEVGLHLPIRARVAEVAVMEHRMDGWRPRERIVLDAPKGV